MNLYLPIDFYLGISSDRRRLLEVPTVICERFELRGASRHAIRGEFAFLICVCFVIDFAVLRIGKNH